RPKLPPKPRTILRAKLKPLRRPRLRKRQPPPRQVHRAQLFRLPTRGPVHYTSGVAKSMAAGTALAWRHGHTLEQLSPYQPAHQPSWVRAGSLVPLAHSQATASSKTVAATLAFALATAR